MISDVGTEEIWRHLPPEAKAYAAGLAYPAMLLLGETYRRAYVDGHYYCPLGAAFAWCEEHRGWLLPRASHAPVPPIAARAIYVNTIAHPLDRMDILDTSLEGNTTYERLLAQVSTFTEAFDNGEVWA